MIKLKDLLTESFFVAITPNPRDKNVKKAVGNPRLFSKGKGAGLLTVTADKILASEVGRNISAEAKDKLEVVSTYDEKGVYHGRTGYAKAKAARKYVSAVLFQWVMVPSRLTVMSIEVIELNTLSRKFLVCSSSFSALIISVISITMAKEPFLSLFSSKSGAPFIKQ